MSQTSPSEVVRAGLETMAQLEAGYNHYKQLSEQQALDIATLSGRNDILERDNNMLKAERDHYARQVTELITSIQHSHTILVDAYKAAKMGAYRPNGNMPTISTRVEQDGAEIDADTRSQTSSAGQGGSDEIPAFLRRAQAANPGVDLDTLERQIASTHIASK
jgi:hypothetical protein